jgi:hypothetical protein
MKRIGRCDYYVSKQQLSLLLNNKELFEKYLKGYINLKEKNLTHWKIVFRQENSFLLACSLLNKKGSQLREERIFSINFSSTIIFLHHYELKFGDVKKAYGERIDIAFIIESFEREMKLDKILNG